MPNLIPEQRADKNGKLVTRHVRPQGAKLSMKPMPAPLSSAETQLARFKAAASTWFKTDKHIPELRAISQSNPDLFNDIMQSFFDGGAGEREIWQLAINIYDPVQAVNDGHFKRLIKTAPLGVVLFPTAPSGFRLSRLTKISDVAEKMTSVSPFDDDYSPVQALIILSTVESLKMPECKSRSQDRDFIAENIEAIIPLLPEIKDRRNASRGFISELLGNQAQAIRDGVL